VAIERTDGLRGLALLDRLDLEAIYLYENHPTEFRRLRDSLTDDAAAELLLHWREYFGLKRSDQTDRARLIAESARLSPSRRRIAARYPNALPLILADPIGVTELIGRLADDPALRARLAEAGPRQAAQFSPERYAARLEALYARLGIPPVERVAAASDGQRLAAE
jgi:hypothetical protein